jgi:hypothetical protein
MKQPALIIGSCVFISWEDSCCFSGWKNQNELDGLDYTACASVGWVVQKTARVVTIAATANLDTADGANMRHTNGHILIPISAITFVKRLCLPRSKMK